MILGTVQYVWVPIFIHLHSCLEVYILKIPNFVDGIGALSAALRLSARTLRVSAGSITPSSHSRAEE